MPRKSKIKEALETVKALRDLHWQAYLKDLEKINDEGITKSLDLSMAFSRTAALICKKIIYILEDIEESKHHE